jgi:hypothetical protein
MRATIVLLVLLVAAVALAADPWTSIASQLDAMTLWNGAPAPTTAYYYAPGTYTIPGAPFYNLSSYSNYFAGPVFNTTAAISYSSFTSPKTDVYQFLMPGGAEYNVTTTLIAPSTSINGVSAASYSTSTTGGSTNYLWLVSNSSITVSITTPTVGTGTYVVGLSNYIAYQLALYYFQSLGTTYYAIVYYWVVVSSEYCGSVYMYAGVYLPSSGSVYRVYVLSNSTWGLVAFESDSLSSNGWSTPVTYMGNFCLSPGKYLAVTTIYSTSGFTQLGWAGTTKSYEMNDYVGPIQAPTNPSGTVFVTTLVEYVQSPTSYLPTPSVEFLIYSYGWPVIFWGSNVGLPGKFGNVTWQGYGWQQIVISGNNIWINGQKYVSNISLTSLYNTPFTTNGFVGRVVGTFIQTVSNSSAVTAMLVGQYAPYWVLGPSATLYRVAGTYIESFSMSMPYSTAGYYYIVKNNYTYFAGPIFNANAATSYFSSSNPSTDTYAFNMPGAGYYYVGGTLIAPSTNINGVFAPSYYTSYTTSYGGGRVLWLLSNSSITMSITTPTVGTGTYVVGLSNYSTAMTVAGWSPTNVNANYAIVYYWVVLSYEYCGSVYARAEVEVSSGPIYKMTIISNSTWAAVAFTSGSGAIYLGSYCLSPGTYLVVTTINAAITSIGSASLYTTANPIQLNTNGIGTSFPPSSSPSGPVFVTSLAPYIASLLSSATPTFVTLSAYTVPSVNASLTLQLSGCAISLGPAVNTPAGSANGMGGEVTVQGTAVYLNGSQLGTTSVCAAINKATLSINGPTLVRHIFIGVYFIDGEWWPMVIANGTNTWLSVQGAPVLSGYSMPSSYTAYVATGEYWQNPGGNTWTPWGLLASIKLSNGTVVGYGLAPWIAPGATVAVNAPSSFSPTLGAVSATPITATCTPWQHPYRVGNFYTVSTGYPILLVAGTPIPYCDDSVPKLVYNAGSPITMGEIYSSSATYNMTSQYLFETEDSLSSWTIFRPNGNYLLQVSPTNATWWSTKLVAVYTPNFAIFNMSNALATGVYVSGIGTNWACGVSTAPACASNPSTGSYPNATTQAIETVVVNGSIVTLYTYLQGTINGNTYSGQFVTSAVAVRGQIVPVYVYIGTPLVAYLNIMYASDANYTVEVKTLSGLSVFGVYSELGGQSVTVTTYIPTPGEYQIFVYRGAGPGAPLVGVGNYWLQSGSNVYLIVSSMVAEVTIPTASAPSINASVTPFNWIPSGLPLFAAVSTSEISISLAGAIALAVIAFVFAYVASPYKSLALAGAGITLIAAAAAAGLSASWVYALGAIMFLSGTLLYAMKREV